MAFQTFPHHHPPAEEDGNEEENGIEDEDACEVPTRTKMRDALLLGGIIDANGNGIDGDPTPHCEDQQLEFGFIARSDQIEPMQMMQRIEAIAALRVGKIMPRLKRKPEVGKPCGEDGSA